MRQMFIEGMLVSLAGGALAILLTTWTAKRLGDFIPSNSNPLVLNGIIDHKVILATLLLAVLTSAICGALPAWRSSQARAAEVFKEETGSVSASGHNQRVLSCLVVTQIALSLPLLVSSGLLLRTLRNMTNADLGFEQNHVITVSIGLGIAGYTHQEENAIQHRFPDRVRELQGVKYAALTDWLPLSFNGRSIDVYPENYVPQLHESHEVRSADASCGRVITFKTRSI